MNHATLALGALCLALAGCGDDDDGDEADAGGAATAPAAASPAGLWRGETGDGRAIDGLVMPDGRFRFLYSAADDADALDGLVAGTLEVDGAALSAPDGLDFGLDGEAPLPFTLEATFAPQATLDGTLGYADFTSSFASVYDDDYENAASLEVVAGAYGGTVANGFGAEETSLTVATDGTLEGTTIGGCTFAGTISPRQDANAYDVSIGSASVACAPGTDALTGLAYLESGPDGRLVAALLEPDGAGAAVFVGGAESGAPGADE